MVNIEDSVGLVKKSDSVPLSYLYYIVEVMTQHDVDMSPYLKKIGLSLAELGNSEQDLPQEDYYALLGDILSSKEISGIGLQVGRKFSYEDYGILTYAFLSCQNLMQAIKTFFRFQVILGSEAMFEESLNIEGNNAIISINCALSIEKLRRYEVELAFAQWSNAQNSLTDNGVKLKFTRVNFTFTKPQNINLYSEMFGCPVYFEQLENQLIFPKILLEQPLIMANESASQIFVEQYKFLSKNLKKQIGIVDELRRIIINNISQAVVPEELAKALNVSYRTLRRRLSEEGTSLKEVYNDVRMKMATENLSHTDLSIQEIAFLLGYADVTTFHRAFKKWSQQTPGEFRNLEKNT